MHSSRQMKKGPTHARHQPSFRICFRFHHQRTRRRMSKPDARIDLGIGTSTLATASLTATIRVRPITIRFTEPGVRDLHLPLHSITTLRPTSPSIPPSNENEGSLIFDLDEDPASPKVQEEKVNVRDVIAALNEGGLMGDENVSQLKRRMGRCREGVKGRRLRLIHAGRILRDGVRLVGYLEDLDLRTRLQSRQTLRQLATDQDDEQSSSSDEEGEAHSEQEEAGEKEQAVKSDMSVRELVDWLSSQAEAGSEANELFDAPGEDGEPKSTVPSRKGKGKNREPFWYDDIVRVSIRTAPTVYLQCSVGEAQSQPEAPSSPPPLPSSHLSNLDRSPTEDLESDRTRGFNRLLDAGLSPTEIASIRAQFRSSHPLHTPYDLIQSREHAQHLLEQEESWMDSLAPNLNSFNPSATAPGAAPAEESTGAYSTVMQGLMVGFFLPPLIPLFWFRDKPHPSSIPNVTTSGEEDQAEGDEEEEWERERTRLTRESVFSSTMQVSILFGLVANVIMGIFRFIW